MPGADASFDPRSDPAWELYHRAFELLAQGERARAQAEVSRLQQQFPGHPAALQAGVALTSNAPGAPGFVDRPQLPRGPITEEPTKGATAELALFQTVHGIAVGVELCGIAECDEAEPYLLLGLLGGGAGAFASLQAGHIRSGTRALLNSGTVWGAFNAGMLLMATQPDDEKAYAAILLGGQAAGIGIGLALDSQRPTAGRVALANSGGQWTAALTGLTIGATADNVDEKTFAIALMVAADAGIGLGAMLGNRFPWVSRAQTLVIDAGGIVGGVAGGGIGVMVSGKFEQGTLGAVALGAAAGLGAAAYLTRNWRNDDAIAMRTALVPTQGGGLVVSSMTW